MGCNAITTESKANPTGDCGARMALELEVNRQVGKDIFSHLALMRSELTLA